MVARQTRPWGDGRPLAALDRRGVHVVRRAVQVADVSAHVRDEQCRTLGRSVGEELVHEQIGVLANGPRRRNEGREGLGLDGQPRVGHLDHDGGLAGGRRVNREVHPWEFRAPGAGSHPRGWAFWWAFFTWSRVTWV